jgi:ferric-dicitrate binding protein FerR (iron transport regulator)
MDRKRLMDLLAAYRQGSLDREGLRELLDTLREGGDEEAWTDVFRSEWARAQGNGHPDIGREGRLLARLQADLDDCALPLPSDRGLLWKGLAIAAMIVGMVAGGWWLWGDSRRSEDPIPSMVQGKRSVPRMEAADRVTLTRADGSQVVLDALEDGLVDVDAAAEAVKGGDGIRYAGTPSSGAATVYNTIATPRGGRFRITLSDGSRVWLNAASSLRFPVVFPLGIREVEVTGQAYFEVAPDKAHPFRVRVGDAQVEVLGTHFDIMAYRDEPELLTTLVEGSVRFRSPGGDIRLTPGQQSILRGGEAPTVRENIDVDRVMAWRDGILEFRGDDIGSVCRALSRAYDVNLAYDEAIHERFHARFPKETALETVLKVLEMTGKVHFEKGQGSIWAQAPKPARH